MFGCKCTVCSCTVFHVLLGAVFQVLHLLQFVSRQAKVSRVQHRPLAALEQKPARKIVPLQETRA